MTDEYLLTQRPTGLPPRPSSDARVLRDRQAAFSSALDRAVGTRPLGSARQLVQIYDGGSMGSTAEIFYLGHPVQVTGTETEGGSATLTVDSDTTIPVVVLNQPPSAGDKLVAYSVNSRWVAEKTGHQCTVTFQVVGCLGTNIADGSFGFTVDVYDHSGGTLLATGTTDVSSGNVELTFTGSSGSYYVTCDCSGGSVRLADYAATVSLTCGGTFNIVAPPASGYHCSTCCNMPLNDTLTVTDSAGPGGTVTWQSGLGRWYTPDAGTFSLNYGGCESSDCDAVDGVNCYYDFAGCGVGLVFSANVVDCPCTNPDAPGPLCFGNDPYTSGVAGPSISMTSITCPTLSAGSFSASGSQAPVDGCNGIYGNVTVTFSISE